MNGANPGHVATTFIARRDDTALIIAPGDRKPSGRREIDRVHRCGGWPVSPGAPPSL